MIQFIYDSCLLYIIVISHIDMSIVNMQTDNIFILADQSLTAVENEAINSVKIMIKTREQLSFEHFLKFDDIRIERIDSNDTIHFRQEKHIQDIQLIKDEFTIIISARDKIRVMLISKKQYIAQRARETYLASICQSEALFDLSRAAQSIKVISDDINALNKRLQ